MPEGGSCESPSVGRRPPTQEGKRPSNSAEAMRGCDVGQPGEA